MKHFRKNTVMEVCGVFLGGWWGIGGGVGFWGWWIGGWGGNEMLLLKLIVSNTITICYLDSNSRRADNLLKVF